MVGQLIPGVKMMVKLWMVVFALSWGSAALAADAEVVDIAVKGMSCPFCVYNVEKNLHALDGVRSADVDLKQGRARVVMQPGAVLNESRLRKAIIDAGFTPGPISVVPDPGD